MAGYRALLRVSKVKHKVITPDKGETKEAAAEAEAFYATSQRFQAYGATRSVAPPGGLTGADVQEILAGATRGFRVISVPRLTQALQRAAALRAQYAQPSDIIDPAAKLTARDLDTVTSAAGQTLRRASAAAAGKRRQQTLSAVWLVLGFIAIIGIGYLVIRA